MIMRWSAWIAAAGAVFISGTAANAQYRQDYYPGQYNQPYYNQPYARQGGPDIAASPRPDFPGPYQGETPARRHHKRSTATTK
jgi:hypothetical protein